MEQPASLEIFFARLRDRTRPLRCRPEALKLMQDFFVKIWVKNPLGFKGATDKI
jgi:hypothetical protein